MALTVTVNQYTSGVNIGQYKSTTRDSRRVAVA
jgi:hypothetical protein